LGLISCKITKNVPNGYYLVDKNNVVFNGDKLNIDEVNTIIRQQPNRKSFGMRLKLRVYNSVDSAKVVKSHNRHFVKIIEKNKKLVEKQNRINAKRIEKAKRKGKTKYTERIIILHDTVNPKLTFKEWIKFKRGERPVIFDSSAYNKSVEQLEAYLLKKGYYYGNVKSSYKDLKRNPKRRQITYEINTGKVYRIDSLYVVANNSILKSEYNRFLKKQLFNPLLNEKFDRDILDNHRYQVAKYMKDRSLYGFSPSNVTFEADTNKRDMKLTLKVILGDRQIKKGDSVIFIPHKFTYVNQVYFHISDSSYFKGNFVEHVQSKELPLIESSFITSLDTLVYNEIYYSKQDVKIRKKDKIIVTTEMLNPWRVAHFYYNVKPAVKPSLLELQNYLEPSNTYKEYYIDRSYNRLMQLDVFQTIKIDIKEIEGTNTIDVHYFLTPSKKQSFNVEPRFTNSNGFLGLAASVNYNNKNLFRGSEKFTVSFSGGFESQPPVFQENLDGSSSTTGASRSFNTFEIGPSVKLDLPGLFILRKATKLSKRHRPRTVLSTAYNFQQRDDFKRKVFQFNYLWKFYVEKTQVIQFGFPAASIKYVQIDPSLIFQAKLDANNDLFLKNAYSDQFIWEDFKLMYEFNNKFADNKKKLNIVYNASFSTAGLLLSRLGLKDTTETGQTKVFGVGFSEFIRLDNDLIFGYPINKKSSFHARAIAGFGVPVGNKTTSMPFDYSFFSGGSNDNRGWRARALGPGSYKYYLDKNRTATQIGDMRLGIFGELRYALSSTFKTAFFLDASNIWTYNYDLNRVGSQFSKNFYREIALTAGTGLRMDLSFFVIRVDVGFPITNPALESGSKWVFQSRQAYYDEGIAVFGIENYKKEMPKPFLPTLSFGIGYPF
jgi:outer membrane protein insertion porin family